MNSMKVAVMDGGNASHAIAADLALKGLTVNMFEMEKFAEPIGITWGRESTPLWRCNSIQPAQFL